MKRIKKARDSGIENDPNAWNLKQPDYILRHIRRVTHVSVESTKIVDELANLVFLSPDMEKTK